MDRAMVQRSIGVAGAALVLIGSVAAWAQDAPKLVKSRYTMKQLSPMSYTFKWEMQGESGTWSTLMEGKSTKAE